jgi:hypothetical protein
MTTLTEQARKIGKIGELPFKDMVVQVKILDFRLTYGRERWLVTPVSGSGKVWVENVKFTK